MKVFANTDVGLVRQLNEDDYCIAHNANDEWMAIVCDGIGGAKAGEVASHTAVSIVTLLQKTTTPKNAMKLL